MAYGKYGDMKMAYAKGGGGGKSGGAYGPGGLSVAGKNPNSHPDLNDTPCGPYSHKLGHTGDGGYDGDESVDHRGGTFHFK
jgi:hypothetical protein